MLEKDLRTGGKIKKVRRQGTKKKGVIIVEMKTWEAKQGIMRNKNRLGARKVYVYHDLTYKEREIQRRIRERAKEERKKEKTVRTGYQKICIQETWHKWNEEKDKLEREESPFLK